MNLPLTDDFDTIVAQNTPLIDVRAPVEFAKGAFPSAVNLPLMNDKEREKVGIRYKREGNEAALILGHQLVSGEIRVRRIQQWCDFIDTHPTALLYCFRGGQRSKIAQMWITQTGRKITRLKGGYKAFRNYLLQQLSSMEGRFTPILLGGRTGSGKTLLLHQIEHHIDLEGLAKHRGSAFGGHIDPQPTQINFENSLAYALLQKLHEGFGHLVFEDEGKNVGRLYLPEKFFETLGKGGLVLLETALEERVTITFDEYVTQAQQEFSRHYGQEEGLQKWAEHMQNSIDKIRRRLGNQRHTEITTHFHEALQYQHRTGESRLHRHWIAPLLRDYYDPMYDYQLTKKASPILFKGDKKTVLEYLRNYT